MAVGSLIMMCEAINCMAPCNSALPESLQSGQRLYVQERDRPAFDAMLAVPGRAGEAVGTLPARVRMGAVLTNSVRVGSTSRRIIERVDDFRVCNAIRRLGLHEDALPARWSERAQFSRLLC